MQNDELTIKLLAELEELKAAWFAETHRGDDMDLARIREIEKRISEIEDQLASQTTEQ